MSITRLGAIGISRQNYGSFAGKAAVSTFIYVGTGGITTSGVATVSYGVSPQLSGGITTGGSASVSHTVSYTGVGGITTSGAAITTFVSGLVPTIGVFPGAPVFRTFDYATLVRNRDNNRNARNDTYRFGGRTFTERDTHG